MVPLAEVTLLIMYGVALCPCAAMVAKALAMSRTWGEAVPKMLLILVPSPAVHPRAWLDPGQPFGSPASMAASRTPVALVPGAARAMFSCAKTVLTEFARAVRRSILPYDSLPKFWTLPRGFPFLASWNCGKYWGLKPS